MSTEREVLEQSMALVNQGWTKGWYKRPVDELHVSYCLYGAAVETCVQQLGPAKFLALTMSLAKTAAELFPDRTAVNADAHRTIVNFNDHPLTTKDDVIQVFEKTIANLE